MSASPKTSRQEKQVRNLERGFMLAGLVLLVITMGMAGQFGWGLGHDVSGKVGNATFFVVADFVSALLMSAVGLLFAWRWYGVGSLVIFAMVICIGFSMASIFGYQSANRSAVSRNYDTQIKRADERLGWLRNSAVDKSLAKERTSFLAEEKEQFAKLDQIQPDPDAQSTELAKLLAMGKDETQRGLTVIGAVFIIFLQFVCLSLRSFLRHRVAPAINAFNYGPKVSEQNQHSRDTSTDSSAQVSRKQAKSDVQAQVAAGVELSNREYAARWSVTEAKASRWLSEFSREGALRKVWRGNRKVAVAPTQHANGKLHVVS